jgi:dolichol-phosphate mannosyltransferase
MSQGPGPWLIVPTFNEAENVAATVAAAQQALRTCCPEGFRILVVDDASPDGTGEIADRLAAGDPDEVSVLHRPRREGLGPAYLAGFQMALSNGATYVIEMDADGSHDPADLPRLLAVARSGSDVVLGSRYVRGGHVGDWGPVRRAISRAGCLYAMAVLGVRVRDLTGGFKCLRREVLETIDLPSVRSRGYAFQVELTYRALRCGFTVTEIQITFRDRRFGRSKMSARIAVEAMWLVPKLRGWRPSVS